MMSQASSRNHGLPLTMIQLMMTLLLSQLMTTVESFTIPRCHTPSSRLIHLYKTIAPPVQSSLKSISPAILMNSGTTSTDTHSSAFINPAHREKTLNDAYNRCQEVTELFSKTFYMGSKLMKPKERRHVWAVYAWCRRTDDIVDSPRAVADPSSLVTDLEDWEKRLENIWANKPYDLLDYAMADTVQAYPSMSIQPYKDMIAGMIMDVPGLGQERYKNFEELYLYCYRVAGTVGLMTLPLFGTAKGYTIEDASEPAISLGIALQLTNILRDVGEDLGRGRIYLPLDEIDAYGLTEDDFFAKRMTPKYIKFLKFQIARAREYYRLAEKGIKMLDGAGKFAVRASLDLYSGILDNLERNHYDNFNKRAYTTQCEKLSILPKSYFKILMAGK